MELKIKSETKNKTKNENWDEISRSLKEFLKKTNCDVCR